MVSTSNRAFLGALVTNERLGFLLFFSFPVAVVLGVTTDAVLVVGDCSGAVIVVVPAIIVDGGAGTAAVAGGGTAAVGGGVTAVLVVLVLIVVINIGLAD